MSDHSRKEREEREIRKRRASKINRKKPSDNKIKARINIKPRPRAISRNNKIPDPKTDENISSKKQILNNKLTSLTQRLKNLPQKAITIDNNIKDIPNRISEIRNNNYYSQSTLEKEYARLNDNWIQVSSNILNSSNQQVNSLLFQQSNVETQLTTANSSSGLDFLENQLSQFTQSINLLENSVSSQLREHQDRYKSINDSLLIAENTLKHLSNTSIEWKINETPILAVTIQDLKNDKHGILVLTNFRFLFEEIKEVVIRKTFFIVTEKKTVREVILEQPIGSIDEINKGNVGFLKGSGLYITFKPQTGLSELKLDTSNDDDEKVIQVYNHIISGEAQKELSNDLEEDTDETKQPLTCHFCSAPITEEIFRGQTSIKCIYCGTFIKT